MKRLLFVLALAFGTQSWGQVDTLEFTTRRQVADQVFGLLNPQIYGPALLDRSLTEDSLLTRQLNGDYSGVNYAWSWLQAYSDLAICYRDSTYMMNDSLLFESIQNFPFESNDTASEEILKVPFALLIHQMSRIDSTLYQQNQAAFENQSNQLKLAQGMNENDIYTTVRLKSAALLELNGQHGYNQGIAVYDEQFISTSPGITINAIELDLGGGFQNFSSQNNKLNYPILKDWQIGRAAVTYTLNGILYRDTISFYTSTVTYKFQNTEKSVDRFDTGKRVFKIDGDKELVYKIKFGCGNGNKIKRPIIFAPPYRPVMQSVGFNTYYDQFDFKSLLSSLSDMGYDVIFVKETPGNRGVDHAGGLLAEFLKFINQQKKENYPNEDWENVVVGFSAGGQHWRYALKKLEYEHMTAGTPHHHTRLYIPFDSPHWGANVPMFAQAVFKDMSAFNLYAYFSYNSLKDAASKDMLMNHILGSSIATNGQIRTINPAPTSEFQAIANQLNNAFNHQFTPQNDLRKTFPTFTRNIAVSLGNNSVDYNNQYGLYPGRNLFSQNIVVTSLFGLKIFDRELYSSKYGTAQSVFKRNDTYVIAIIPINFTRHYKTNNAYEWDMAQGGYKDEFYDKGGMGITWLPLSGIPVGAVTVLRASAHSVVGIQGPFMGTQHYKNHMSFLPMVSALGINPSIWQNNNLYYNLKDQGLMYNQFNSNVQSDLFGYPQLGHPTNHFNITPFEAVYCDPQTYQHIKMQQSIDDDNLPDSYLVHTRNFILDEVEADIVYLQNKVIGKNHVQWDPNYRYKAWYKAYQDIVVGANVTPKTDSGPYTIEKTGDITMYACHEINLKPGFSSDHGSSFHGFIRCDGCYRPHGKSDLGTSEEDSNGANNENQWNQSHRTDSKKDTEKDLKVFPNPTTEQLTIIFPDISGEYIVSDVNGRIFETGLVGGENKTTYLSLPKGVYYLKWIDGDQVVTKKILVL